jgi:phosphoserine phosphatase RsbU/P
MLPVLSLLAIAVYAQTTAAPTLAIDGLGKGSVALDGPWQFHLGDDMRWAQADFDDATSHDGWETIRADRPWGAQGHYAYTGFAWYRRHLSITYAPGVRPDFRLFMPQVTDVYEVYWNGALIGTNGKMPPNPSWPVGGGSHIFRFPDSGSGVLAIRVWMAPLSSSSSGKSGGLTDAPFLGSARTIEGYKAVEDYHLLLGNLYVNALSFLRLAIACAALLMWLRKREETLFLWLAIFAGCPGIWTELFTQGLPIPNDIANTIMQPLFPLFNIALWFLLLQLLDLRSHRMLVRWTKAAAFVSIVAGSIDGLLVYLGPQWSFHPAISIVALQWADGVLTMLTIVAEVLPLFMVAIGIRRKLDTARWAVALAAFVSDMLVVTVAASQQGQRFTHWSLPSFLFGPIFSFRGVYVSLQMLADTALIVSILYAVYRYSRDQRSRQRALEEEFRNARELQQVLIPEELPAVPGFSLTSAYKPALEVGGDFFQIVPLEGGSTLIVLGDVSGKGLKAAMAVSLIVGAIRTLAESTSSPGAILAGLSRRLHGRLQNGFATCIAMRLERDGACSIASAGHPAPILNEREVSLPGALPLGIQPTAQYEEMVIRLNVGDHFALYTDGLLEARSDSGELYSFTRLQCLFASHPSAAQAAEAAVNFGQDDDITVLTLTRLASGEEPTTQLAAPRLASV